MENTQQEHYEEDNSNLKIVQLILDEAGMPTIQSSNLTAAEIIGALELAKEILLHKRVSNPLIKQTIDVLAQSL